MCMRGGTGQQLVQLQVSRAPLKDIQSSGEKGADVSANGTREEDGVDSCTSPVMTKITGSACSAAGLVFVKEVNDFQLELKRNREGKKTTFRRTNQQQP